MIDPVIFTIGNFSLRWYGVIVMLGVIVGSLLVEREIKHRGENGDRIWDALIWVLPIGIIGARLWYVLNATLGGNRYYVENPIQIINIPQGGLHIFGGLLLGAITLLWYLKRNQLDAWLFLDVAGPALLIGQAIGRVANFINQELYGPPTNLPWGIKIEAEHRLPEFQNLNLFPVETTRFHPTFAYEMLWNFAAAGFLLWASRRYEKDLKPGTLFAGWLILAGVGRIWIEFFRPDQPKIEALGISYTTIAAAFMGVIGVFLLMARYKAINMAFSDDWEEEYQISGQEKPRFETIEEVSQMVEQEEFQDEPVVDEDHLPEPEIPQDEPVAQEDELPEPEKTQDESVVEEDKLPQLEMAQDEPVVEEDHLPELEALQVEPVVEVSQTLEKEEPQGEPVEEEKAAQEEKITTTKARSKGVKKEAAGMPAKAATNKKASKTTKKSTTPKKTSIAKTKSKAVKKAPVRKTTAEKTTSKTAKKPATRKKTSTAKTKSKAVKKAPARKSSGKTVKKSTSKEVEKPTT